MAAIAFPHDYKTSLGKCNIKVDGDWYDCTTWRHSHPGGAEIVDQFHMADATDAFYALHSVEAIQKLKKMKATPCTSTAARDVVSVNFEKLRHQLEKEGWFRRDWRVDAALCILPVIFMCVTGFMIANSWPILATILIGVGMQQAGWVGHDYSHGRGKAAAFFGVALGSLINGFSTAWWSHKHNTHHTFPNRKEFDADIHNEPILHLWFPSSDKDVWHRRYQHLYYPIAYSFLYASWRLQSIQFVLGSKNWVERILIATNYILLACLPWKVAVGSILLGGLLVAVVVTANHQTEEILASDAPYNFIRDQFSTTRGIHCSNLVTEYLFGGMQYQLEHHLFPIMPRYYYPSLRPIIKQFAKDNGLQHHISGVVEIIGMNYQVMKKFSQPL